MKVVLDLRTLGSQMSLIERENSQLKAEISNLRREPQRCSHENGYDSTSRDSSLRDHWARSVPILERAADLPEAFGPSFRSAKSGQINIIECYFIG